MSVLLFSMETRRKQVSTSKHSQNLSILPLPVVWEEMKGICAPPMPDLQRTGKSREGRTHGARSEEEHGAATSQPPPAHTQREGESLHLANTSSSGQGSKHPVRGISVMLPKLKTAGRGTTSWQSTAGPVLPPGTGLSPQGTPGKMDPPPLTATRCVCRGGRVCVSASLPSQSPGVWGWVPLPSRNRGGGRRVRRRGGRSDSPHGTGEEQEGIIPSPLTEVGRRKGGVGVGPSPHGPGEKEGGGAGGAVSMCLPSWNRGEGSRGRSVSPHRTGEGERGDRCLSLTDPREVAVSVSLSPHGPATPGRGRGPDGCPHRVPHEPLEAEALLLGGAPRDDERLRLLAGPGRPRGRGRRHVPAASAPRPDGDVTPRDAPGLARPPRPVMAAGGGLRGREYPL